MAENALYYGDNLGILRRYVADASVDLVYIDPPFNSNANYNVLFKEHDGASATSQIKAFDDTWHWDVVADRTYRELLKRADPVAQAIYAFYQLLGTSDMLAYLVMMAARLVELHRVLKPTGTFYLHCDPSASHYLKIVLDAIFGPTNFLSEIDWKRTGSHSSANRWGPVHDVILVYAKKRGTHTWNRPYVPLDEGHRKRHYGQVDADGRAYTHGELTAPGTRNGRSGVSWRGFDVATLGRHWCTTVEKLDELDRQGRIYFPPGGGWPRLVKYQEESLGRAIGDVWDDIPPLNMKARERLGYPTQKPEALLRRIVAASSNPGDIVLDAFCGCGTTVAAAQSLGRRWIGIDITHTAIAVISERLNAHFGAGTAPPPIGQPQTVEDARQLAKESPYAFEDWAVEMVGADQPARKRGSDKGIDGRRVFGLTPEGKPLEMLVSVKSGKTGPPDVRDLRGTMERVAAAIGLFITLQPPTKAMKEEALSAGYCDIPGYADDCPRMQILTIAELLEGEQPVFPIPIQAAPKQAKPRQPAEITPFQRPLPGTALIDASAQRPTKVHQIGAARTQRRKQQVAE